MAIPRHKTHHGSALTLIWRPQISVESKIFIGAGVLNKLENVLRQINSGKQILLLTQKSLPSSYMETVLPALKDEFCTSLMEMPDGEEGKSVDYLLRIWERLQTLKFTRQDTVLAIGGGALTDVAGFAAATYMRGINFVGVPTTLLAQVDASIGGKTAINLPTGKNLAGSFYFAKAIIVDTNTVKTLSDEQFISGMGEIIKYALIEDTLTEQTDYTPGPRSLLRVLEQFAGESLNKDSVVLPGIITSCIKMKLAVVAKDPLEVGLRRCLNLGHTLGHALEKATNYQLTHGQAVSVGLAFALKLSIARRKISDEEVAKAIKLLEKCGLPIRPPESASFDKIIEALSGDKKRDKQAITMVLPKERLGFVDYETSVDIREIEALARTL